MYLIHSINIFYKAFSYKKKSFSLISIKKISEIIIIIILIWVVLFLVKQSTFYRPSLSPSYSTSSTLDSLFGVIFSGVENAAGGMDEPVENGDVLLLSIVLSTGGRVSISTSILFSQKGLAQLTFD